MNRFLLLISWGLTLTFASGACTSLNIETEVPVIRPALITPSATHETSVPTTRPTSTPIVIEHQTIPGDLPAQRSNHAGDQDSSTMADRRRAPGGDRFTFGQFERPFNAETMDIYFPYLDIQEVAVFEDETWIYGVIELKGHDSNNSLSGRYAMEFDLDLNGRGDYLVMASQPSSTEWTTDGVQVWMDKNGDVGGSIILNSDMSFTGDGYETLVFHQNSSDDPDAAWARISPEDPHIAQIAVKRSLFGDDGFLVGMWAGIDDLNPVLFDLNDHYTHEQAGEAMRELRRFYPINELSGLDNTCRMSVGFQPKGNEPGICR